MLVPSDRMKAEGQLQVDAGHQHANEAGCVGLLDGSERRSSRVSQLLLPLFCVDAAVVVVSLRQKEAGEVSLKLTHNAFAGGCSGAIKEAMGAVHNKRDRSTLARTAWVC